MGSKTVADLAPTAVAGGVSEEEVREATKPVVAEAAQPYVVQAKRFKMAVQLLREHPELSDETIAKKVTSIPVDAVGKLRSELAAVKADPTAETTAEKEKKAKGEPKPEEPLEGESKP